MAENISGKPSLRDPSNSSVIRTAVEKTRKRLKTDGKSLAGFNAKVDFLAKQRAAGLITEREQANAINNYGIPKQKKAPRGKSAVTQKNPDNIGRTTGGQGALRSTSPLQRQRFRRN